MITGEMLEKFKEVINPYVPEKKLMEGINGDTNLITDLKINSAQIIDIVLDVEDKFGIQIDDDSIGKMQTVENCINVIAEKLALV
jgi:acyl carrier protein